MADDDGMVTLVRADGEGGEFQTTGASAPGWIGTGNWKYPDGESPTEGEEPQGEESGENTVLGGAVEGPLPQDVALGEQSIPDTTPGLEQQEISGESSSDQSAASRGRRNR